MEVSSFFPMALSHRKRTELQEEERQLVNAITTMAQRLEVPSQTEHKQVERWRERLVQIRSKLRETFTVSRRMQDFQARRGALDQQETVPQYADSQAALRLLGDDEEVA